jgi:hypothetical protein
MPTGARHFRLWDEEIGGVVVEQSEECRCTIGEDHHDSNMLSQTEAEDIWLSSGMEEDYDFR